MHPRSAPQDSTRPFPSVISLRKQDLGRSFFLAKSVLVTRGLRTRVVYRPLVLPQPLDLIQSK